MITIIIILIIIIIIIMIKQLYWAIIIIIIIRSNLKRHNRVYILSSKQTYRPMRARVGSQFLKVLKSNRIINYGYFRIPGWILASPCFVCLFLFLYFRRVCRRVQRNTQDSRRQEDCRYESLEGKFISLRLILESVF